MVFVKILSHYINKRAPLFVIISAAIPCILIALVATTHFTRVGTPTRAARNYTAAQQQVQIQPDSVVPTETSEPQESTATGTSQSQIPQPLHTTKPQANAASPTSLTPQTATGISYANINHYQYCDGTGNGTVEYISSITFGLNGMTAQPTTLTYMIETQSGTHSEISYPMSTLVASGAYSATAFSSMPSPNALIIFTFYAFDEPGAVRVRVTAPYSYTGAWLPLNKVCG
jgi:hypothetical protein